MSRRAPRYLPALALTVLAGPAAAAVSASAEPPSPEDRVDAVIAEFEAVVTEAGFVYDGERQDIDDPLGLTERDDDSAMDDCLPDNDGVVADDGTFTGQLAGTSSGEYRLADGEPLATEAMGWRDYETVGVAVAIVDEDATPNVRAVVAEMASDEFADCLGAAFDEWLAAREDERPADGDEAEDEVADSAAPIDGSVSVEALDIGDAAAIFSVSETGDDGDGEERTVAGSLATAMVGDTFIAVAYSTFADASNSDIVEPALEAAAAALG